MTNPLLSCFVCGSKEIVTTLPIPLCFEHNLPPQQRPDDYDDMWEADFIELNETDYPMPDYPTYPI